MKSWGIHEAKQRFREVIRLAKKEGPQEINFVGKRQRGFYPLKATAILLKERKILLNFSKNRPINKLNWN